MKKAYVTIFFSIAMALCMSLFLGMIYAVRENAIRMKAAVTVDTAMTSTFAEYNRVLWEQYGLIFVDASYQSQASGLALTEEHIKDCMNENFSECEAGLLGGVDLLKLECTEAEAEGVILASDENGAAIRAQAVNLMKFYYKLEYLDEVEQWVSKIEAYDLGSGASYEEANNAAGELSEHYKLDYSGWLPSATGGNDISEDTLSPLSILYLVADTGSISTTKVDLSRYAGKRELNAGNLTGSRDSELTDGFFLREYFMKYCGNYRSGKETGVLSYQAEYLCNGKASDCDNLAGMARRILVIREAANMITLTKDAERMGKIKAFCEGICTLLGVPEAAELLEAVVVACWANYESLTDLKIIFRGGKIPLVKDSGDWITGIESALSGGADPADHREGLSYEDYLRIFLYLTGEKKLMSRFEDLVEMDLRKTDGNEYFRIDNCFDEIQAGITVSSDHGYELTAVRRRKVLN